MLSQKNSSEESAGTIFEKNAPARKSRCRETNDCSCDECRKLARRVQEKEETSRRDKRKRGTEEEDRPCEDVQPDEPECDQDEEEAVESQPAAKKRRKYNWKMEDDKALLELISKYNFSWDLILRDFTKHQHRRPNETEKSLEKRWKNVNARQGKYSRELIIKPFKPSNGKKTDLEKEQEEAVYKEKVFLFSPQFLLLFLFVSLHD
jgi:hypothetical protein